MKPQRFKSFSELARHKKEGEHYNVVVNEVGSSKITVIAPHGGGIEPNTSELARKIAANDHSLYLFEGCGPVRDQFYELHVTSTGFDEPRCVNLAAKAETIIAVHGCAGETPVIYIGGRDKELRDSLAEEFNRHGIRAVTEGHAFPGASPDNICNKNRQKMGVQLEFSRALRNDPALVDKCARIVRGYLRKVV
jgi:phage replication-related protein YjqB (UPF0714/DUF867 family)